MIFKESYECRVTTGDCAHSVPDSLQLVPRVVCSFNITSKEVASLSDYAVRLHDFVSMWGLEVKSLSSASTAQLGGFSLTSDFLNESRKFFDA